MMKKLMLLIIPSLLSFPLFAQLSFGLQVGANAGIGHDKDDYYKS
ncbi:MAG: hypothetical protein ABIT58_01785 [Ferruginibacter sp.]